MENKKIENHQKQNNFINLTKEERLKIIKDAKNIVGTNIKIIQNPHDNEQYLIFDETNITSINTKETQEKVFQLCNEQKYLDKIQLRLQSKTNPYTIPMQAFIRTGNLKEIYRNRKGIDYNNDTHTITEKEHNINEQKVRGIEISQKDSRHNKLFIPNSAVIQQINIENKNIQRIIVMKKFYDKNKDIIELSQPQDLKDIYIRNNITNVEFTKHVTEILRKEMSDNIKPLLTEIIGAVVTFKEAYNKGRMKLSIIREAINKINTYINTQNTSQAIETIEINEKIHIQNYKDVTTDNEEIDRIIDQETKNIIEKLEEIKSKSDKLKHQEKYTTIIENIKQSNAYIKQAIQSLSPTDKYKISKKQNELMIICQDIFTKHGLYNTEQAINLVNEKKDNTIKNVFMEKEQENTEKKY